MIQIGNYNKLEVVKEVSFGVYLNSDKGEILMPAKYVPQGTKPGDILDAFVYKDSEDRLIATTLKPKAVVGEFASLQVKDVNSVGAFLDWGLEKDLFLPFEEQHKRVHRGDMVVVKVVLDPKTERLIGIAKFNVFLSKDVSQLEEGQEVNLFIYEHTDLGTMAIIDNKYKGILYENELFKRLEIGDQVKGYIKKIREDGKIDLTLKKFGYDEVVDAKNIIYNKLVAAGGSLPFSDNSSPEEIKKVFQMSKKTFKKGIGALYKEGKIVIEENSIVVKGK